MEEKAGAERQNSKKGFEKNEQACSVEGVFVVSDPSARPYLKVAGQTRKIQSSSKLWQVRKWNAEIPDTPLGLTGIGKPTPEHPFSWPELESEQNELLSGQTGPQVGNMFEKWTKLV